MKKLEGFFSNCSNPEFFKKVWEAGGVSWKDYKASPADYYAADTGMVPGMIYYSDTAPFAKRNLPSILEALRQFESECGPLDVPKKEGDGTAYYNWMAWFAWENMASELQAYLES